ncbi:hypothetical protein BOTBODRAFT_32240 [Botryobasidium botryosum FD-172 SS1]|uniref:DUF7918 domain-containing protein n=1 Tax=Botryobasidium botryosum (strain FD-172 SS1) TaxID=930990 RepID=A0A067MJK1_BOTB1|nr:hypothetical protein BOTBODRAFT_32240 [Botryobasidium botryosum FD-172 SS1]
MPTHRGFSAWIVSGGQTLEEFKPETEEGGRTKSCWVPSEAGKKFEINWMDVDGIDIVTSGEVSIDGHLVDACSLQGKKGDSTYSSGIPISRTEIRPFLFSTLEVTDNETAPIRTSADLGTISLTVWRVILREEGKPRRAEALTHGPVHEKSKKGGSHVVGFGAAEKDESYGGMSWEVSPYSPEDKVTPYVKFVFKYRPLDLLQANDIAPRPKTSVKSWEKNGPRNSESIKIEGDDVDEKIRVLEEQVSILKSQKRKSEQEVSNTSKKMKSEDVNPQPHVVLEEEEIIDLT